MENLSKLNTRRLWSTIQSLTPSEIDAGHQWYDDAYLDLAKVADRYGIPIAVTVNAAATLSPGLRWPATLELLVSLLDAHAKGQPMPRNGHATFGFRPRVRAWEILKTGDLKPPRGPKVSAFAAAILGDRDAVVVDRHAVDAAGVGSGIGRTRTVSPAQGKQIAAAIRTFAYILDLSPRDVTAALWLRATT